MTAGEPGPDASMLHMVSHGKSGGLGCFAADAPMLLERAAFVVVESVRGLEAGQVVGPASQRHARLLGPALAGRLLRPFSRDDAENWQRLQQAARSIFERARILAADLRLALEVLDVDLLFDGCQAILQFVGQEDEAGLESLARALQTDFAAAIRFENLQQPTPPHDHDHGGGCGKPDCGKNAGGSCGTCGTGGGCSSCGSGVDIKPYFAHLRGKMDAQRERVPLL